MIRLWSDMQARVRADSDVVLVAFFRGLQAKVLDVEAARLQRPKCDQVEPSLVYTTFMYTHPQYQPARARQAGYEEDLALLARNDVYAIGVTWLCFILAVSDDERTRRLASSSTNLIARLYPGARHQCPPQLPMTALPADIAALLPPGHRQVVTKCLVGPLANLPSAEELLQLIWQQRGQLWAGMAW